MGLSWRASFLFFSAKLVVGIAGREEAKNLAGVVLHLIQIRFRENLFSEKRAHLSSWASPNFYVVSSLTCSTIGDPLLTNRILQSAIENLKS